MTVRLDLQEYETRWVEGLSAQQSAVLHATGAVAVQPVGAGWQVTTTSVVGHVTIGDLRVRIRPKIAIGRLMFLLLYAADPRGWRSEDAELALADDLPEALAHAFVAHMRRSLQHGLLRGYVSRDEALPVLRGRIRAGDQLASRAGLAIPIEVTYDDYTTDIPENQVLAGAVRVLLRGQHLSLRVRAALTVLERSFEQVAPWPARRPVPRFEFHRLNAHYEPAVALARLILAGDTLDAEAGETRGTSLLFDMNRVFEDFLTTALRDATPASTTRLSSQHHTELDEAGRVPIRPDLTWWRARRCVAVADAKYKDLRVRGLPNSDLYQMLAYCTALGLDAGHLVYGAGEQPRQTLLVRQSNVALTLHTLNLAAPPDELLVQVQRLGNRILESAGVTGQRRPKTDPQQRREPEPEQEPE